MSHVNKIRFYFSFRSPFAAIAFYRLRRCTLFKEFDIQLIPLWPDNIFGGHMDNPTDNLFKAAYIFADAARQAKEAGLSAEHFEMIANNIQLPTGADYTKAKVGMTLAPEPWGVTHHAFLYAQEQGKEWEFGDAVFNRRFNFDGSGAEDVMNLEVLSSIAEQVGLNNEEVCHAYSSGRYTAHQASLVKLSEADGVFGVPYFAFDRDGSTEVFWGNDRLSFLHKALTDAHVLPVITAESLLNVQPGRD